MVIGVPKEIKDHEYRVSVTPDGVRTLRQAGHEVWIERSAGVGSGYSDEDYRSAGATMAESKEQLFQQATLIVKVKEPLLSECHFFRPGQTLFTYLHLASLPDLTKALLDTTITAIAYETIEAKDGTLPMLKPMSEIAGRMSVQIGAHYLGKDARRAWASVGRCAWSRAGEGRRTRGRGGGQRGDSDCGRDGGPGDGDQSRS